MAAVLRNQPGGRLRAGTKPVTGITDLLTGVYVLWLKHMWKFRHSPVEILGTLMTPLLWMLLFGVCIQGIVKETTQGLGYQAFITPGVMLLTGLTAAVLGGAILLFERLNGTIKEYLVAPVPRLAVLLGTMASGLTKAMLQAGVVLVAGYFLDSSIKLQILPVLGALGVVAAFVLGFVGLSAAVASRAKSTESYHSLIMVMNLPVLFLSNSLYPLDKMPPFLRGLALLNPTTYAVDACRVLLYNTRPEINLGLDLLILVIFMLAGLALGYHFFKKAMQETGA